jgi:hypothetical protein
VATFPASVEDWRDLIAANAGDLPNDFLLGWIQIESNGNPCSWTRFSEAGIFQLMAGDNIAQGGTTLAAQHPVPPCASGVQTTAYLASLSSDQAYEQVRGGLQYVNYCRDQVRTKLAAYGYAGQPGWTESDWSFWAMVKMWHVAPGVIPAMLQAGIDGNGGIPTDWDAMAQYVTGVSPSWLSNARTVGVYGDGGGSAIGGFVASTPGAIIMGLLGIGLGVLAARWATKRYLHPA